MIERELDPGEATGRFILRPQRSATWRDNLLLVGAVALAAVPIAVTWAALGFWPILPLCGLELALLTLALYAVNRSLLAREVVIVDRDAIVVEAGHRELERRYRLGRAWAQVLLVPVRRDRCRLVLRSHGRAVELGRFLTDEERETLAGDLRAVVGRVPAAAGPG